MSVSRLLDDARLARRAGDGPRCLALLREARDLAAGTEPADAVAWRLAKAEVDFGTPSGALDALTPTLARPGPFEAHDPTPRAVDGLARHVGDRLGYGDPRVAAMWAAYAAHHRAHGEPFLAAWAEVQGAWAQACRGELAALHEHLARIGRMDASDLAGGSHRHARAEDAAGSVAWLQLDLARTALHASVWAGDAELAWEAADLADDAAAEVPAVDPWLEDARARVALRFGGAPGAVPQGEAAQLRITRAVIARSPAALDAVARDTLATHAGPEWAADAWSEAARLDPAWAGRADEVIARFALWAFGRA